MELQTDLQYYLQLLQKFSLITTGEGKTPNFSWKLQQTNKLSESEFIKRLNYKGGIFRKDGTEIPATKGIGIATGFEDLECLDIDTKVFFEAPVQEEKSDQQKQEEKNKFESELFQTFRDHIEDFDKKVVVYKTRSGGFHILYKAKNIEGNLKLAKLQGHNQAVLETRSKGGYILIYKDNQVSDRSYFDVDYITDKERDIIIQISMMYDYKDRSHEAPLPVRIKPENAIINHSEKNYAWTDYNNKTEVWDLIKDEFTIIRNESDKVVVLRNGSKAQWSGYIYKDTGCLYLFSTGTIYPSETLLSPFQVLAYQKYNGDPIETAKKLYREGYGDRLEGEGENKKKKSYKRKYFFSEDLFKRTLSGHKDNIFLKYLKSLDLPEELIRKSIQDYYLGTITKGEMAGSVTLPFIDEFGRINSIMVKYESKYIWLHSMLQQRQNKSDYPEWLQVYLKNKRFNNCLFGIHLLKEYPYKNVMVVERPEDAILGSIKKPELLWLASGEIAEIQPEIFRKLKGKNVSFLIDSPNDDLQDALIQTEIEEDVKVDIHQVSNIQDFLLDQGSPPAKREEPKQLTPESSFSMPPKQELTSGLERIKIGLSLTDQDLQELAERLIPERDSRTETELILALMKYEGLDLQDSKNILMLMRMQNILDITSHNNYFLFKSTPF